MIPPELFLITGQSLATGRAPAISTMAGLGAAARCLTGGPVGWNDRPVTLPARELSERGVETIASGFAAHLLAEGDLRAFIAGQAWVGQPYATLKKGGETGVFEAVISQTRLARQIEPDLQPGAILLLHGETDGALGTPDYDLLLEEWVAHLREDLGLAMGMGWTAPLLFCQTSSISGYDRGGGRSAFRTPLAQLHASERHPDMILVGPKYAYDYIDWAHIDAPSTRLHGEYFAKAYKGVRTGRGWHPLSPASISCRANRLHVEFRVPEPPLVLDTDTIPDPGWFGFHLSDPAASIRGIRIASATSLEIDLTAPPAPGSILSYALHNGVSGTSGRMTGARGCLRDSDATRSVFTGQAMPNWCVAFARAIPAHR
ncbi:hypothetical protein [Pseudoroseicyclus aestuarii]|uniref:Sialate O-acetylesterase domain-containing protein n=1 Tax=Pseudoroseicyclus aestuarii TaxID=1795041 RepID=A0A318SLP6_9RHOB|nr:hypothetical protein [Pseudoroseicyclus aestuarii]PYE80569.1 hypothetical protein DFP88_1154 [Pseudoroseicyclus aestuarii]